MKKATFVIAVYNDTATLNETINNLLETVSLNDVDIIVVDDANTLNPAEVDRAKDITIFKNPERKGVGYSLDFGIRQAKTDVVLPMGCDIRFSGDWFPRFYEVIKTHPRAIVSTVTAGLNGDRRFIQGKEIHYHGAHILFHVTTKNNNRVLPFREYLEAKWNNKLQGELVQIGVPLGAHYGINKKWFEKISPWGHHKVWGTLEPVIALASYANGGRCLLDLKTVTGHIFKSASSSKPIHDLIYNKLLTAYLYLPEDMEREVFNWAKGLKYHEKAFINFENEKPKLKELRFLKDSLTEEQLRRRIKPTGILNG